MDRRFVVLTVDRGQQVLRRLGLPTRLAAHCRRGAPNRAQTSGRTWWAGCSAFWAMVVLCRALCIRCCSWSCLSQDRTWVRQSTGQPWAGGTPIPNGSLAPQRSNDPVIARRSHKAATLFEVSRRTTGRSRPAAKSSGARLMPDRWAATDVMAKKQRIHASANGMHDSVERLRGVARPFGSFTRAGWLEHDMFRTAGRPLEGRFLWR